MSHVSTGYWLLVRLILLPDPQSLARIPSALSMVVLQPLFAHYTTYSIRASLQLLCLSAQTAGLMFFLYSIHLCVTGACSSSNRNNLLKK